jgi:transcription termination factor Rho
MNLKDLKQQKIADLLALGKELSIEEIGSMRRQDLIFAILKSTASQKKAIFGEGVLEILPDVQLRYLHYPAFLTNCTATALSAYLHYIEP